jgi:hypothetical protein
VGEPAIGFGQGLDGAIEGGVEGPAVANFAEDAERGAPRVEPDAGRLVQGQRNIPVVGLEGTAISRRGIRPARQAARPASTACRMAQAICTGSVASASAVFIRMPSTPCSIVRQASLAVPTPASTMTGTERRRLMVRME